MAGTTRKDIDAMHHRNTVMHEALQGSVHYAATHSRSKKPGRLDVLLQEISDEMTARARAARRALEEGEDRRHSVDNS